MLKRIKAIITAVFMATFFPVVKIEQLPGEPGAEGPAQAVNPPPPETPPARTPEERINELEGELSGKNTRIIELENLAAEAESRALRLNESFKQTVAAYKNLLISANPDILPELFGGDTPEALDQSLAEARELTGKIKTNLAARESLTRVPAGAPVRGPENFSGLSSRDKIQKGISG